MSEKEASISKQLVASAVVGLVLLGLLISLLAVALYLRRIDANLLQHDKLSKIEKLALAPQEKNEPYTVLVMGVDKRKKSVFYRADALILIKIDPRTHRSWVVSIPRDIPCAVENEGQLKLSECYTWGQEVEVVSQVQKLIRQKINHVVVLNFSGCKKIVNAMGGVEVDVSQEIFDEKADYTKDKHASSIHAGKQVLDGAHALTFVRSRNYQDGDFSRIKNQQLFFKSVAKKATKMSMSELLGLLSVTSKNIDTDMTFRGLFQMAFQLKQSEKSGLSIASLTGTWKAPYVILDEKVKENVITKLEKGEPFENGL